MTDVASATPELSHNEPVDNRFKQDDAEHDMVELVLISSDESNSKTSKKSPSHRTVQLVIISNSDSHEAGNSERRSPRESGKVVHRKRRRTRKGRKELNNQDSLNLLEKIWLRNTLREANFSPFRCKLKFTGQLLCFGS